MLVCSKTEDAGMDNPKVMAVKHLIREKIIFKTRPEHITKERGSMQLSK
jgi:hypothetical protein